MEIEIKFDSLKLKTFIDEARTKATKKAVARSLNDTLRSTFTHTKKSIRERVTLSAKNINKNIHRSKTKVNPSAPLDSMLVELTGKAAVTPLGAYKTSSNKKGVRVKVNKNKSAKTILGAFTRKINGHKGVFMTARRARKMGMTRKHSKPVGRSGTGKGGNNFFWHELPIIELFSKTVATSMTQGAEEIRSHAQKTFNKRFDYHFKKELAKIK